MPLLKEVFNFGFSTAVWTPNRIKTLRVFSQGPHACHRVFNEFNAHLLQYPADFEWQLQLWGTHLSIPSINNGASISCSCDPAEAQGGRSRADHQPTGIACVACVAWAQTRHRYNLPLVPLLDLQTVHHCMVQTQSPGSRPPSLALCISTFRRHWLLCHSRCMNAGWNVEKEKTSGKCPSAQGRR